MTLWEQMQSLTKRVGDLESRWPKEIPVVEPVTLPVQINVCPTQQWVSPEVEKLNSLLSEAVDILCNLPLGNSPRMHAFLARARVAIKEP